MSDLLSRFDTIPERDTDKQTDGRTEFLHRASALLCWRAIKSDAVTIMIFPQVNNSDVFCCVVNGNQVGVAMQRLASVDSIRPRNAGRTQIVAAVNCADAGKVGRNIYNCNTKNRSINQSINAGQDLRHSRQQHYWMVPLSMTVNDH